MEKISHTEYTFKHWLEGHPEPDFPLWPVISDESGMKRNPVYIQILEAKNYTFDKALEFQISDKETGLNERISNLDPNEKNDFIQAELERAKLIYSKYAIQDIINKSNPDKLKDIDGRKYAIIKKHKDGLDSGEFVHVSGIILNDFHSAVIHYKYSKYCHQLLSEEFNPEIPEKLKNLPHKLCILYDLGILDLIEERFKYKEYKGTAPQTDKAKLISSLFEIEYPESVRLALKNNDYLTNKAKSNAVETLKNHGLEPKKIID